MNFTQLWFWNLLLCEMTDDWSPQTSHTNGFLLQSRRQTGRHNENFRPRWRHAGLFAFSDDTGPAAMSCTHPPFSAKSSRYNLNIWTFSPRTCCWFFLLCDSSPDACEDKGEIWACPLGEITKPQPSLTHRPKRGEWKPKQKLYLLQGGASGMESKRSWGAESTAWEGCVQLGKSDPREPACVK